MQTNKFIQINKNTWYLRLGWDYCTIYDNFLAVIKDNVYLDKTYHILCKVRYDDNKYIMLGNQYVFKYTDEKDIKDLYDRIDILIGVRFDKYNIDYINFEYIIFEFIEINKVLLSDIQYNKERIKSNNLSVEKNIINIPITIDDKLLGNTLEVYQNNGNLLLKLPNPYDDLSISNDLYKAISEGITKVYFRYTRTPHLLYITIESDGIVKKSIYTLKGSLVYSVEDKMETNNELVRSENKNNKKIVIDHNNEIVSMSKNIRFSSIPKRSFKDTYHQNINIGVLDLETFYDGSSNSTKVYAAGFRIFNTDKCYIEYIDQEKFDSNSVIINLILEMLRPKYENIKFYCHNLGGYDAIYILKALYEYNQKNNDKFIIDTLFNNKKALKIAVKKKSNKGFSKVTILDSYTILNSSLRTLAKKYEVDTLKGYFPYRFVNYKTLFYKGNTPDIKFYDNIDNSIYDSLKSENWDLKYETIKYLERDLNSLYEVIRKFSRGIYKLFDSEVTDSLTISSLSLQIFMKNYYNENNLIPNIKNKKIYSEIREAYYGGITEVYKPRGNNLFYYDVNSLYPFVSKNDMVGLHCIYTEYIKGEKDISNMFGFYYAEIDNTNSDSYFGLLPFRQSDGLYFPIGKWSGWYFSEELKFALNNGYNINIIKGYTFEKQKGLFDKYVDDIYSIKSSTSDSSERTLAKSLLNNLLGRFGMDINKPITQIVDDITYEQILLTSPLIEEVKISENTHLISYIPTLDSKMAKKLDIDPQKSFTKFTHLLNSESDNSKARIISVPISAAVSSYGRIHISKIKLDIMKKGGNIYYSDTDSIVTDIELDSSLVSPNELGKLKLEYKIKEGYFISNKTYAFITDKDKVIKKSKGLDSNTLDYKDYTRMYYENYIEEKYRIESVKDYSKGSVNLERKKITLSPFSYRKREKIYKNGLWVDTKPIKL